MNKKNFFNYILFLLLILFLNLTLYFPQIEAAEMNASSYEINLILDYPKEIISEIISIQSAADNYIEDISENIYLERFKLINEQGREIDPSHIIIETSFIKESLDRQHRFLVKKSDQEKGWFKIKIASEAVYNEPGIYTADIFVENLDWEVSLTLNIKPFVSLELPENEFQLEIGDPSQFPLYISPENYYINIKCNHYDWSLQAYLEEGGLISEKDHILEADKVMYILKNIDNKINLNRLDTDDFFRFRKEENITILSGEDYEHGFNSILFAIRIGDSWSDQPAGLYKGTVIFTLIEDYNNNW